MLTANSQILQEFGLVEPRGKERSLRPTLHSLGILALLDTAGYTRIVALGKRLQGAWKARIGQ